MLMYAKFTLHPFKALKNIPNRLPTRPTIFNNLDKFIIIILIFSWKSLSGDQHLYLFARKLNLRSNVGGLNSAKQLIDLLCIVYLLIFFCFFKLPLQSFYFFVGYQS